MFLTELFDVMPQHEVAEVNSRKVKAWANIGNETIDYVAAITNRVLPDSFGYTNIPLWDIEFRAIHDRSKNPYSATGTGQPFKVMGFIINCVKMTVKNANKELTPGYTFSCYSDEPTKVTLYIKLLKKFALNHITFTEREGSLIFFYAIERDYLIKHLDKAKARHLKAQAEWDPTSSWGDSPPEEWKDIVL